MLSVFKEIIKKLLSLHFDLLIGFAKLYFLLLYLQAYGEGIMSASESHLPTL